MNITSGVLLLLAGLVCFWMAYDCIQEPDDGDDLTFNPHPAEHYLRKDIERWIGFTLFFLIGVAFWIYAACILVLCPLV